MVVVIGYVATWGYLQYETKRAHAMLHDLASINVGDGEDLVLSLSRKFDCGIRRPNLPPITKSRSSYWTEVDPWEFDCSRDKQHIFQRVLSTTSSLLTPDLRRTIGLRQWKVIGRVDLNDHKVVGISVSAAVEGATEWLGGMWQLSQTIPQDALSLVKERGESWPATDRFLVGWQDLDMPSCKTVCDFVPAALEYVNRGTWNERKNACTQPRPRRYR